MTDDAFRHLDARLRAELLAERFAPKPAPPVRPPRPTRPATAGPERRRNTGTGWPQETR